MIQNLEQLRIKVRKTEELEAKAKAECVEYERKMAYCSSEDVERRRELAMELREATRKRLAAQEMRSTVSSQYNVAQGAVRCMLDNTQMVQKNLREDIAKGRQLLKNASVQLEQYKDNSKKV